MVGLVLVTKGVFDVDEFLLAKGLKIGNVWELEVPGKGIKISRLRTWLKMSYLSGKTDESMVFLIRGADNLSEECQNILLKPLEEAGENILFVLQVKSESRLLPTIMSRCRAEKSVVTRTVPVSGEGWWRELVRSWRAGPGESIGLVDKWAKEDTGELLEFFILKLAGGLRELPSSKKVKILQLCLELQTDLRLMVNPKLVLGKFLLDGWKIAGLD